MECNKNAICVIIKPININSVYEHCFMLFFSNLVWVYFQFEPGSYQEKILQYYSV